MFWYADTAVLETRDIQDTFFEKAEKIIYRYDLGSGCNKFQVSIVFFFYENNNGNQGDLWKLP